MTTQKKQSLLVSLSAAAASIAVLASPSFALAAAARADLRGKILLQVQQHGEAWYVRPVDGKRVSLPTAAGAFAVMRSEGVGISENNIWKIPVGFKAMEGADTDGDTLTDAFESAIGTDPNKADTDDDGFSDSAEIKAGYNAFSSVDKMKVGDSVFVKPNLGKIFLQVEKHGEAWWVNPADGHRYFLGRPSDAYALMRGFGLGITDADLNMIDIAMVTAASVAVSEPKPADVPASPVADTALAEQPSPVGSGFTSVADFTSSSSQYRAAYWGEQFADASVTGTVKVVQYVDDVAKLMRTDASYGDTILASTFVSIVDGNRREFSCKYPSGPTSKPVCRVTTGSGNTDYAPSEAAKASIVSVGQTRTANRTVAGMETSCYASENQMSCYYADNASVIMYKLDPNILFEVRSFTVGRPDPAVFVEPTDFDAPPAQ